MRWFRAKPTVSWFDVIVITILFIGGFLYLHDVWYWGVGYIGGAPYGDAQFWWDGAVHLAHGIFKDNPGKGYRPGYFVLAGFTLPALGEQFNQFYPYFLLAFLTVTSFFYMALRSVLGRWVGSLIVAMIIFNPFTAEWIATSTTDGTGLLLNLAALSCLIFGFRDGLKKGWLVSFGIFFAFSSLTRPLMTPFLLVVVFGLLVIPKVSLKQKLLCTFLVLLAFTGPTFLWMTAQKVMVNQWSLSSNDASSFYAASDPKIQVWNPEMYTQIAKLAEQRYHIKPDDRLINRTFWHETIYNYLKFPKYHIQRIIPHFLEIAKFSPQMATHGNGYWRTSLLTIMVLGLIAYLLFTGLWWRAVILGILGLFSFYFSTYAFVFMTLLGAAFGLSSPRKNPMMFFIASYWIIGVIALYFVGGTWGPPMEPTFALNALGYRLGAQVFFAGDLLTAYFFFWLAFFKLNQGKIIPLNVNLVNVVRAFWQNWVTQPSSPASYLVALGLGIFLFITFGIYVYGGSIIFYRAYAQAEKSVMRYPSLNSVINLYRNKIGNAPTQANASHGGLDAKALSMMSSKSEPDLIFTGAASPFIWNLPGQKRTQLLIHSQKQEKPITMGPSFIIAELPLEAKASDWAGVQGAYVIRKLADRHNTSNLPYYLTTPSIRAFIPLSSNGKNFDLERARWFDLIKNATELETSGELKAKNATITWSANSGVAQFQRRFFLATKNNESKPVELILDVTAAKRPVKLSFSYLGENQAAIKSTLNHDYDIAVFTINDSKQHLLFSRREKILANTTQSDLKHLEFNIPDNTQTVKLIFNHLSTGSGIWFYEFNLTATDFGRRH